MKVTIKRYDLKEADNLRKLGKFKLNWPQVMQEYKLQPIAVDFFLCQNPSQYPFHFLLSCLSSLSPLFPLSPSSSSLPPFPFSPSPSSFLLLFPITYWNFIMTLSRCTIA